MQDMKTVSQDSVEAVDFFQESIESIRDEVGKVIVGQKDILDQLLICLFSRGHCVLI
jgi:MoxR-like ATPase